MVKSIYGVSVAILYSLVLYHFMVEYDTLQKSNLWFRNQGFGSGFRLTGSISDLQKTGSDQKTLDLDQIQRNRIRPQTSRDPDHPFRKTLSGYEPQKNESDCGPKNKSGSDPKKLIRYLDPDPGNPMFYLIYWTSVKIKFIKLFIHLLAELCGSGRFGRGKGLGFPHGSYQQPIIRVGIENICVKINPEVLKRVREYKK